MKNAHDDIRRLISAVFSSLLLVLCFFAGKGAALLTSGGNIQVREKEYCVVIDAGHGGIDPGKVGVNGVNEKEINLEIAFLLKNYLEAQDVKVVMTRESDEGLYDADATNKKVQDMKRRVAMIEEYAPDVAVSIHQNSYPQENVKGAQVFYYGGSKEGSRLAAILQDVLIDRLDKENRRREKANDSYYMLKKTSVPIVIVECGFLSNAEEAKKLCDEGYRDDLAWAIHLGILRYLYGE